MSNTDKAKEKFTEIKTAMLLHAPFFASLLLDQMKIHIGKFPHLFGGMPPTAATDGKNVWFDEDFLATLKLPEAVFLTCHEIGHAMWQHMARAKRYESLGFDGKKFNPGKWNRAGDYIINDLLTKAKVGNMPKGGLLDSKYDSSTQIVDDVYRILPDDPSDGSGGNTLDKHVPGQQGASDGEWKRAIQSAAENAKAQGKMPAGLQRIVDSLLNPRVDWRELLRTQLVKAAKRDAHTWAKYNRRRLVTQGVIMPGFTGFGAGTVVVGVDTSGSIGERELKVFLTETQNILDTMKPERLFIVPCDAEVHETTEVFPDEHLAEVQPKINGGGGTDFRPVFDWVEKEDVTPACLVYLTDMCGGFPQEAPDYKTIWCSTSKGLAAPFGELIEVDLKEYTND